MCYDVDLLQLHNSFVVNLVNLKSSLKALQVGSLTYQSIQNPLIQLLQAVDSDY